MKYFLTFLIIFFSIFSSVFANEIYFDSKATVKNGEVLTLPIYLDSSGENINTIDVEIYFNNEIFIFTGYKEGVFKNWIIPPKVENNKIYFTGIVPGGVEGVYDPNRDTLAPLPVITLSFKAKNLGNASFIFVKNEVLKNDGQGSNLNLTKRDLNISVVENTNKEEKLEDVKDINPPLPFTISIVEDEDTGKILVFNTTDLETGISYYQIKDGRNWSNIVSPYKLNKPFFDETLTIRAYDFNGNYAESFINIKGYFNKYVFYFVLLILASILLRKLIK
jgi:hypothetical protein